MDGRQAEATPRTASDGAGQSLPHGLPRYAGTYARTVVSVCLVAVAAAAVALAVGRWALADREAAHAASLAAIGLSDLDVARPTPWTVLAGVALNASVAALCGVLIARRPGARPRRDGPAAAVVVVAWCTGAWALAPAWPYVAWPGAVEPIRWVADSFDRDPAPSVLAGPLVVALAVLVGTLVGGRPVATPTPSTCTQAARLLVLGLVVIGTALAVVLVLWVHERASDPAPMVLAGAAPALVVVVALTWTAAGGGDRTAQVVGLLGAGLVVVESALHPSGAGRTAWESNDPLALAVFLAAGLTVAATTWFAGSRRRACDALGRLAV